MKIRLLISILSISFVTLVKSQTIFWSEGFGTGCVSSGNLNTPNGTWNITNTGVNGADANTFIISGMENGHVAGQCGTSCSTNDMTLHIYSPVTGDNGAQYLNGGFGIFFPQADQRCESPTINCTGQTGITLKFNYLEFGDGLNDNAEVWWFNGSSWALLQDMAKTSCCGGPCNSTNQGNWGSVSIAMPAGADNNPNVKIGFHWINNDDGVGEDPPFAVDSITMSVISAAVPVVSIVPSPNDSICVSTTLTLNGSATNGPITSWTWSVTPSAGVTFNPNAASQNPTVTFTTAGTYTFTLQASNGTTGTATQVITVLPGGVPSVTITASPANPVCAGTNVSFTATPTNGGATPSYQWQVNGSNVGSNSPNFSSSTLSNNDVITVTITSSDSCVLPATASASYTIQVNSPSAPTVTIVPSATTACQGTAISFTATPTNGGTTPSYQWMVNSTPAGSNSPNFSSSTLVNGDVIYVVLTSNDPCASPATANSNSVTVSITPTVVPSVTITASPSGSVCAGTTVNFTATPTNGGTSPTYNWSLNSAPVGSNSPNFSSSTLNNGDTIRVQMISNAACATPTITITSYTIQVIPVVVPSVTVLPASVTACVGDSVVFNASTTNGGTSPIFQWTVGGSNAGTNSNSFTLNPVAGGEVVVVQLTSNATCATPSTTTSNTVTVTANPLPTISVTQNTTTVCPNVADTLIATATAGSTFTWTPAAGLNSTTNDTAIASNSVTGTYTYYVTATLNGCSKMDSIQIIVANTFTASAGAGATICEGDSTTLSVTGGTTWTWTPTGDLSCTNCQNPVASPTTTTTFSAVANQAGCLDTVMQTVTVIPNAVAGISYTVITQGLPQTVGFSNASNNANTFFWTLGNGSTSAMQTPANQTYPVSGSYTVTLIAYGANGCNDTTSVTLLVTDTVGVTVPNIFTPNGDQINDVWQPSVHGSTSFECYIYNRYGILVYQFLDSQDKWDGHTTSGQACTEGTYFYILKATDTNKNSYNLKGYLQLIR